MKQYQPKYWNHKGKYQKTYEELYDKYVPGVGTAQTEWGEIIRVVGKLYYDIYNNGGCNFDCFREEIAWLKNTMPASLSASTVRFCKQPKYNAEKTDDYKKFLDKYVDAAITYADMLLALSRMEL